MKNQPSKRNFFCTTVTVKILTEGTPVQPCRLSDLDAVVRSGDVSGSVVFHPAKRLSGRGAAKALVANGSKPALLGLTRTGADCGSVKIG
jgi:hypothetical protein